MSASKGPVGNQQIGGHLWQQRVGSDQIMRLSWGEQKRQALAERVDQGMDFCAQPVATVADGLILIFFWRAGAVLMGTDNGAIDHRIVVIGIGGEVLKHSLPYPALGIPRSWPNG